MFTKKENAGEVLLQGIHTCYREANESGGSVDYSDSYYDPITDQNMCQVVSRSKNPLIPGAGEEPFVS